MKKYLLFFSVFLCGLIESSGFAAITIKKAAPVAKQETTVTDATASLVPTVLGLIGSVNQLSAQQRALTQECIPTTQEINFVNETVKEWAKTGSMTADGVQRALKMQRCSGASGGYAVSVQIAADTQEKNLICYDYFGAEADKGMVWENFPKASIATYCPGGELTCSDKKTSSNIYDIFNLIDFSEKDYTAAEATMAAKLIAKIEKCSNSKLSAKKRAMWGEFLMDTISNIGQPTSTDVIMQQVTGVVGGGAGGALQSLGSIATQFIN